MDVTQRQVNFPEDETEHVCPHANEDKCYKQIVDKALSRLARPRSLRDVSATMLRYIARSCPKCHDYFGIFVNQELTSNGEHPINAYCAAISSKAGG